MALRASEDHYRDVQRIIGLTVAGGRRAWSRLDLRDLDGSFREVVGPELLMLLGGAQTAVASLAEPYVDRVLVEQNFGDDGQQGRLVPQAFAGVASDGRPLPSLLRQPLIDAKVKSGQGVSDPILASRGTLERILWTQVGDASRNAESAVIASRAKVGGWTRVLNPPSCSRCVVLAGRWYRYSEGFQRHPQCFPAGVSVSGPSVEASTRRWYDGEVAVLTTAGGQELTVTVNHPVLTGRGWVAAHSVREGDDVFRSTRPEGATAVVQGPHKDQVPALVEDVWGALAVGGVGHMPSSAEDFHGDGGHGEVHVVGAYGALRNGFVQGEGVPQVAFPVGLWPDPPFVVDGAAQLVEFGHFALSGGDVGGSGLLPALVGGEVFVAGDSGFTHAAAAHAGIGKNVGYGASGHTVLSGEGVFAASRLVGPDDGLVVGGGAARSRWDAPALPDPVEQARAYARLGLDLVERLAGQVEADRVVRTRRFRFSGHVFSLSSSEGWHAANGLIVSNCDCYHVPAAEDAAGELATDPRRYFDSLTEAQQDATFGKAGAKAIRDGADIGRVVNARRGMNTSQHGRIKRDVLGAYSTRAGLTRRGRFPGQRDVPYRLMPESIYEVATSRQDAIRLLRRNGYLR